MGFFSCIDNNSENYGQEIISFHAHYLYITDFNFKSNNKRIVTTGQPDFDSMKYQ